MLILDALFAISFGFHAIHGQTWPPVLWNASYEHQGLVAAVGVYMLIGAFALIIGLTVCLSSQFRRWTPVFTKVALSGMWFLWSAYAISLVFSISQLFEPGGRDEWALVVLWAGETAFLGIVLLGAYFDPAYRYFASLAKPLPGKK